MTLLYLIVVVRIKSHKASRSMSGHRKYSVNVSSGGAVVIVIVMIIYTPVLDHVCLY